MITTQLHERNYEMKAEFRTMWRTAGLSLLAAILTAQANAQGGNTQGGNAQGGNPQGQLLVAPPCLAMGPIARPGAAACTPSTHRDWLADITHWRAERRIRIGYDGSRYNLPQLQWAEHSFMQPQMMVHDRYCTILSRGTTQSIAISMTLKSVMAASMQCSFGRYIQT
jgi:hypothetical protein